MVLCKMLMTLPGQLGKGSSLRQNASTFRQTTAPIPRDKLGKGNLATCAPMPVHI